MAAPANQANQAHPTDPTEAVMAEIASEAATAAAEQPNEQYVQEMLSDAAAAEAVEFLARQANAAVTPSKAKPAARRAPAKNTPTAEELERQAAQRAAEIQGTTRQVQPRVEEDETETEPLDYEPRSQRARRNRRDESIEAEGMRRAKALATQERALLDQARKMRAAGRRDPEVQRRLAELQSRRRTIPDSTNPVDSLGNPLDLRGKVIRWVTDEDAYGRKTTAKIGTRRAYGYQVVLDPHTKQPIRGPLGVLMAGDIDSYAEYAKDKSPEDALTLEATNERLYNQVEDTNRSRGSRVAELHVDSDHKVQHREVAMDYAPGTNEDDEDYDE